MSQCQNCGGIVEEGYSIHFQPSECIEFLSKTLNTTQETIRQLVVISENSTKSIQHLLNAITTYGKILDQYHNISQNLLDAVKNLETVTQKLQESRADG